MNNDPFNDGSGLPRYRRPNKKHEALEPLADGIKARHEKGYPDQAIAEAIHTSYSTHPVLKEIKARDVRQFRTLGSRRAASSKKSMPPPSTNA